MAVVTKAGTGGYTPTTVEPPNNCRLGPFLAGEDIDAGTPVYLKSDGKIWKATGAAANAAAVVCGWTVAPVHANGRDKTTVFKDVNIAYGSGLTPGAMYYLGTTAGTIDTAATTGGTVPIAMALDDGVRIRVWGNVG